MTAADRLREKAEEHRVGAKRAHRSQREAVLLNLFADAWEAVNDELDIREDRDCPPLCALLARVEEIA